MKTINKAESLKTIAVYTADGYFADRLQIEKEISEPKDFFHYFHENPVRTIYEYGFRKTNVFDDSIIFLIQIAKKFIEFTAKNADVNISRTAPPPSDEILLSLLRETPYVLGCEFVNLNWIKAVWISVATEFETDIRNFACSVEEYFHNKNEEMSVAGRVFFHLVEHKGDDYSFAFLATYATGTKNHVKHQPLKFALEEHKNNQEELLTLLGTVSRAAEKSDFISELTESGELFSPLMFTPEEAYIFLRETPLYEECGIVCRIPDFWKAKNKTRLSVSVGSKEPSAVGLDAVVAFAPDIYLGDEQFSREEIEKLLSETSGLAYLKGKWIELDKDKLQQVLNAYDRFNDKNLTFAEALRLQAGIVKTEDESKDNIVEISNGEWLSSLRVKMLEPARLKSRKLPSTFKAALRRYQQTGFNWLNLMSELHFGALLADDMGLGKTVQILALLEFYRKKKIKTLLIIPASLIGNWQKEAAKFAPKLKLKLLHSAGDGTKFLLDEADLFVTTYGMTVRTPELAEPLWDLLIIDEAQAIKNHANKQTKSVKAIQAKMRIAMTGTPIENRLSDLWSIFDFLNKGLLGTGKEFSDFSKSLKTDISGYEKLRNIVTPFILRRLKTDKSIISDLPEKLEIKQFVSLSKKQIVLYQKIVDDVKHSIEELSGIERRGVILASIMKLKQICNHPDQFLGQSSFEQKYSGKFETLGEICETIREKRERVLIFTQFKEMTAPIADFLSNIFGVEGLILHGGTAVKKRSEMVERFNSREYIPFMVLSLKAGGTGLNLTSANHVIHFDRWWNPAIENQATDRAFRIGQQKNVSVYKFITTGTIEEKIDIVIENKQKLASDIIPESLGEKWITEMSNAELENLFRLEV